MSVHNRETTSCFNRQRTCEIVAQDGQVMADIDKEAGD